MESISRESSYELDMRVLHHNVRCHGLEIAKLGGGKATEILTNFCVAFLSETWRLQNSIQHAKDAAITGIDIALKRRTLSKYDLSQIIAKLGELFEATGDVETAADLYSEVATFYCRDDSNFDLMLVTFRNINFYNTGLAYRNCRNWTKSEEHFIQAWHHSYKMTGSVDENIFSSTLILYLMIEGKQTGNYIDTPDKRLNLILGSLMKQARISAMNECARNNINNGDSRLIKSQFHSEKNALEALKKLAEIPTIDAFRKAIVNTCALSTIESTVISSCNENDCSKLRTKHTDYLKNMMDGRSKNYGEDTGEGKVVPYHCVQCRKLESATGGRLRMCACKTVYYG